MTLSREARILCGITLLTVPTIMYGGATLLGILTSGAAGLAPPGLTLSETQWALFRAGHAHAGVWLILSLVVQVLLDSAALSPGAKWLARIAAPLAAVTISGGVLRARVRAGVSMARLSRRRESCYCRADHRHRARAPAAC